MSEFWIQTFTRKKFDLLEPDESMICIEDIAHHLSIENRFGGATKFPLAVGYHSVNMVDICPHVRLNLDYLMHDAHEAYTKDLPTPIKRMFFGEDYDKVFMPVVRVIQNKFKVEMFDCIKIDDRRMAITERNQLLTKPPDKWHPSIEDLQPFERIHILNLDPRNVEQLFLKEYEK